MASQPVPFFRPTEELVNPRAHVWLFALPREEVGKAALHQRVFYDLLGLSCRHKCCQMSPILRIPFTFKAFHLCISVHGQKTRLVQGSGIKHPRLSNDKKCSKSFKRNPEHKSPAKAQRSAVFLKPVLKVLLSLPIATRRLLPIPMTTIY